MSKPTIKLESLSITGIRRSRFKQQPVVIGKLNGQDFEAILLSVLCAGADYWWCPERSRLNLQDCQTLDKICGAAWIAFNVEV